MNELHRKLPGAIRTGCIIPVDAQAKDEIVPQSMKGPLLQDEETLSMLSFQHMSRDYPELVAQWTIVDQEISLDSMNDEEIDFGPLVDIHTSSTKSIHLTLLSLFQRYLVLTSKGALEKIMDTDYVRFDAMLSFLVRRRKTKVILWVKQFLGAERFMDEWEKLEQSYLIQLEALLKRCAHTCSKCQLECMRSACHSFDEMHDCGMSHECRSLCEYCMRNFQPAAANGTKSAHGCGVRCTACEYYCDKPVGHEGEHSAAHGNMRNMHFVAQDSVIAWEDRKYVPGEKGIAEMCNMYCSSAGRGHVHYLKCEKETAPACVYVGGQDQRRHCQTELHPPPEHQIDEVLHEKYWKTIGWEDPCRSASERASFAKCPYLCDALEHKRKSPSYCDLAVWHSPAVAPPSSERGGLSYISGHRFSCSHTSSSGKVHHVFVLDCSGSMRGQPWGMLVSGVRRYLRSRLLSGATQDIVSVVTFGDRGIVEYERVSIGSSPGMRIDFHGGGTFYSNGLRQANAIFSRTDLNVYRPVLVFFTDGRPADRKKGPKMAVDVRKRYAKSGLRTFVVGYGRASELGLADLAEKLGGTVHEALTAADLGQTFQTISMSLGARAGLLQTTTTA
ncbi:hypothetical protein PRNP1_010927 [Phytophthora ramorum]